MNVLLAASLVFTAFLGAVPTAAALGPASCSVNVDETDTCTFDCAGPGTLTVSATASAGEVTISGSCGAASAKCTDSVKEGSDCPATAKNDAAGQGTCKITKGSTFANDDGTGTCGWSGTSSPRCKIDLRPIICVGGSDDPEPGIDPRELVECIPQDALGSTMIRTTAVADTGDLISCLS